MKRKKNEPWKRLLARVRARARVAGLSAEDSDRIARRLAVELISEARLAGRAVYPGLGVFRRSDVAARKVHTPTAKKRVPAKTVLKFRALKAANKLMED